MKMPATLITALDAANATDAQRRMAALLLAINGIENALEFADGIGVLNRQPVAKAPPLPEEVGR